jgi:hypothetical protein
MDADYYAQEAFHLHCDKEPIEKKLNKKTTIKKSYRILCVRQKMQSNPIEYKHQLIEGKFFPKDYDNLEEAERDLTIHLLKDTSMDEFTIIPIYKQHGQTSH